MKHVFFQTMWMAGFVCITYLGEGLHQNALRREALGASAMLWAVFCRDTIGLTIDV